MLHKNTFTKKTSKYINKKLQNHRTKNYGSQDVMMLTPLNLNDGSETIPSLCGNFDLFSGAVWSVFGGELYTSLILQFDLPIEFRSTNFWGWPFRDFGRHMDTQVVQNYLMQPLQKGVSRWFRSAKVFKSSLSYTWTKNMTWDVLISNTVLLSNAAVFGVLSTVIHIIHQSCAGSLSCGFC